MRLQNECEIIKILISMRRSNLILTLRVLDKVFLKKTFKFTYLKMISFVYIWQILFCCFTYIMSNINNALFFKSAENVNVTLWMIYYKQQIVKNQKKMINLEVQIVERQIIERRKLMISVTSVCRRHCRKAERNTWLEFWHSQTLHKTFRFSFVHFFFLVLKFSFNEYRLSRTTVTLL